MHLTMLSGAAAQALRTAYSKAKHIAVLASAAAQVSTLQRIAKQYTQQGCQALQRRSSTLQRINAWHISIEGLPVVAGQARHTAACFGTWHIIIVSPPDATALSQHTAAYISARLIILTSPPNDSAPAQHAAAYGDSSVNRMKLDECKGMNHLNSPPVTPRMVSVPGCTMCLKRSNR